MKASSSFAAFETTRKFSRTQTAALFREREGTAFIVRREEAEAAGLPHQFASRMITLTVHSSLEAIGFLAAITGRLAEAGISVNAVSAFYHDHLFVPEHRAEEALHHLQDMSSKRAAVARMERSAIRGHLAPGFRFAPSGLLLCDYRNADITIRPRIIAVSAYFSV